MQKKIRPFRERKLRPPKKRVFEYAPTDRISAHSELAEDFTRRVLGLDWALISDESYLSDFLSEFGSDETEEELIARINALSTRIKDIYDVDVTDLDSLKVCEILERIAAALESPR
jgi:hypothetical protein